MKVVSTNNFAYLMKYLMKSESKELFRLRDAEINLGLPVQLRKVLNRFIEVPASCFSMLFY